MPFTELQLGPYESDELRVARFTFEEAISRPFSIRVEFSCEDQGLNLEGLLGKPGTLSLKSKDGTREVHGIISMLAQTGGTVRHAFYEAEIVPPLWLLSQRAGCRIFQNQGDQPIDLVEIITQALEDAGLSDGTDFEFRLTGQPRKRICCVQYRESDLAFVSRLLEDEGIYYFFEHEDQRCKVVFADAPKTHPAIEGDGEVRFATSAGMVEEAEQIVRLSLSHQIRPGAVRLTDYRFEEPTLDLEAVSKAPQNAELEIYDFPGTYEEPGLGAQLTKVRLEEARARREQVRGVSNCVRLHAGCWFDLDEHPRDELNRSHLITEVRHRGEHPEESGDDVTLGGEQRGRYSNEFTLIPLDTPFRPERVTPRPFVRGTQTAIVVGPTGSEIYCDEHSRVKIQFHWDRYGKNDENSSCWVRVSQPWAGKGWGGLAIPRVGQEVIIDFLEGDPDRPIMTGRVYNGDTMPPQSLPAASSNMTIRSQSLGGTGGSNEITMNDTTGQEGFYVHAQYNLNEVVENDKTVSVGMNETSSIGVDRTETVGQNETITVGVDRTETVGANETVNIGANRTDTIGADDTLSVGSSQSVSVGSSQTVTVGMMANEAVGLAKTTSVGGAYALTVGGAMNVAVALLSAEEVGLNKTIIVGSKLDITCGSASATLEKSGKITVKGTDITVDGTNVTVIASGTVSIKGNKITLN